MGRFSKMIRSVSYCSRAFSNRYNGIVNSIKSFPLIDSYKCYREQDIDKEFINSLEPSVWNHSKGGGYWTWKPWLINHELNQLGGDDMLLYIDGGCSLNSSPPAISRFEEYIDMVKQSSSKMLVMELEDWAGGRVGGVRLTDGNYTNSWCVDYIKSKLSVDDDTITHALNTNQRAATIQILQKSPFTKTILKHTLDMLHDTRGVIFSDQHTKYNETHRHDQSVMSLLYKIHTGDLAIPDETYFGGTGGFNTNTALSMPIWATRSKR